MRLFRRDPVTAKTIVKAPPEQVLGVLTDPDEIRSWSPIPFEVDELDGRRLEPGSVTRVSGSLAGRRVGFEVEAHAADADGLELTAAGPISIDVLYALEPNEGGSEVTASIGVRGGSGLTGRLLAHCHERAAQGRGTRYAPPVGSLGRPKPLPASPSPEPERPCLARR